VLRVPEQFLEQAQDDATRLAVSDLEHAEIARDVALGKLRSPVEGARRAREDLGR
jgi:hypothetical protein